MTKAISIHALRVEGDLRVQPGRARSAQHFYPRPPGGGRRPKCTKNRTRHCISIHALRVEGDDAELRIALSTSAISIHALRVEGDQPPKLLPRKWKKFLSTPSGWRATFSEMTKMYKNYISIHALRVEGDCTSSKIYSLACGFLSTPSGWRATFAEFMTMV